MITRMVFIRHGQSTANLEQRAQGQLDVPLTELGRAQARQAAEYLSGWHFDAAYSSDLSRAFETGSIIAARHPGLELQSEPELREMYIGRWQGILSRDVAVMYPDEYDTWINDWWNARPGGGESMPELARRAQGIAWKIARENPGKTVLVATHGTFLRTLQLEWLNVPGERIKETPGIPNCSVYVIDYDTETGSTTPVIMGDTSFQRAAATGEEDIVAP